VDRLTNAWRRPPQQTQVGPGFSSFVKQVGRADPGGPSRRAERAGDSLADLRAAADSEYEAMCQRLRDAHKTPALWGGR
jgi:hypothetical protein